MKTCIVAICLLLGSLSASASPDLLLDLPLRGSPTDQSPLKNRCRPHGLRKPDGKKGAESYIFGPGSSIEVRSISPFNNLAEFTLCAWINPTEWREHENIISKCTPGRDFNLQLNHAGQINAHFEAGGYQHAFSKGVAQTDQWTYVVATFQDHQWRLYLNGRLDTAVKTSANPAWTGQYLTVGNLLPDSEENFTGQLRGVKVYKRALNAKEIAAAFKSAR